MTRALRGRALPVLLGLLIALPAGASADDGAFQVAQLFGGSKKRSKEAAELNLRVDGVEQEIRNLTGKLEELSFQIRQLQDQLRRMQEDNEFRFQELEGTGRSKRGAAETPRKTATVAPAAPAPAPSTSEGHVLGTLPGRFAEGDPAGTGQAAKGPLDLSAMARGTATDLDTDLAPPTDDVAAHGGEPAQAYEAAYNRILQGDYRSAESMFQAFLADYPGHRLAGNAQYWLGESLFARGLYREAADAFLKSYSEYPGSSKGPDSLLKLGLALAGLGEQAAACATYGELLSKFPDAPASVKQRATVESRVIGCAS